MNSRGEAGDRPGQLDVDEGGEGVSALFMLTVIEKEALAASMCSMPFDNIKRVSMGLPLGCICNGC